MPTTASERVLFIVQTTDEDSDQLYPYGVRWEMTGQLSPEGHQIAEVVWWADSEPTPDPVARLLDLDRCVISYRTPEEAN